MREKNHLPGLTVSSNGCDYQLLSDEQSLYFVRLGRTGHADAARAIASPQDFVPGAGNSRIPREKIRRAARRGRATLILVLDDHTMKLTCADSAAMDAFLHSLPSNRTRRTRRLDGWMLAACFALAVAALLIKAVPALSGAAKWLALGWIAIPLVVLGQSPSRRDTPFLGMGEMAVFFSCVFLWLTPSHRPDRWVQALLPALLMTLVAVAVYAWPRRPISPVKTAAVALMALIIYAPSAVLCLNQLPAMRSEIVSDADLVELTSQYNRGDWEYYAVVDADGVQNWYRISREEYTLLNEGGAAKVVRTSGSLGIVSTDIRCE